jgi:hypothetical protein
MRIRADGQQGRDLDASARHVLGNVRQEGGGSQHFQSTQLALWGGGPASGQKQRYDDYGNNGIENLFHLKLLFFIPTKRWG